MVICEPAKLAPIHPIAPIQRVHRQVRDQDGKARPRIVLQPITAGSGKAVCSYAITSVLTRQPKKGITLFLATRAMPLEETTSSPASSSSPVFSSSSPSSCSPSCYMISSGGPLVIKAVPQSCTRSSSPLAAAEDPIKEIAAMQQLMDHQASHPHPHVIPLLDCMQDQDYVYLVLPYLSGGDLFSLVKATDDSGVPEPQARSYFRMAAEGLLFMKKTCGLAHHDVSLENIAVSSDGHDAQIIDLGMCLQVPQQQPPAAAAYQSGGGDGNGNPADSRPAATPVYLTPLPCFGKPSYVSPQMVKEEACDPFAADVWSLGVCLYTLLTGHPLYSSPNDPAFKAMALGDVKKVVDAYERYGLHMSTCAKDLICHMLQGDPTKRPTLEEVLQHAFLARD